MRSIVCHQEGMDELNPELGGALQHAGVCDCFLRVTARSYSASMHDIPMAQVDSHVAPLDARASSLLSGMLHFLRIVMM